MIFRLDRFFFDEKDIFVFIFGLFLLVAKLISLSVLPFRFSSLVVIFLFLVLSRSLISQLKFNSYLYIVLAGFLFSLFLSPYGLAIYFFVAIVLYTKTNLV